MALYGTGTSPVIEALINGSWTDVSSRVRGEQAVNITRGRANEQGRTSAQNASLTLENSDAYFSNRAPASANYGLIPKNTQLRVSAGTGDYYLRLPFTDSTDLTSVSTADKAVLDLTGDLDIRAEIWPHTWRPGLYMIIASKWQTSGNNWSWALYLSPDGTLRLSWTTGGTQATRTIVASQSAVPASSGRLAVRATLDVNNGAGGKDVAFYTSDSISGSWTALGGTTTTAGTTSVFSGAADLVVGGGDDVQGLFSDGMGFGGKVYKFELYNGIAGTRVANMDATARTLGTTSWSDGLATPNTWTIAGTSARISTDRLRFWGELSSLPKTWDESGTDVTIRATASGMIRRLSQGATPIRSAMYRNFTQYDPYAYWPFEDGSDSTSAASAATGGRSATTTAVSFATAVDLPGAETTLAFTGSTSAISGTVPTSPTNTGTVSIVFYVKISALPASEKVFCTMYTSGTARRIEIAFTATTWVVRFYNGLGTEIGSTSTNIALISPVNQWIGYNLLLQTSGSDMTYSQRWDVVGDDFGGGVGPTTIASASVRPVTSYLLTAANDAVFNDAQFGHFFLSTQNLDLTTDVFREASNAYLGETAGARMDRLCTEESVPFEITGYYSDTETMGYQRSATFMDLIYECWDADGGIGGEARDALLLTYRTRVDLERRDDMTLDYSASEPSQVPVPTDDDQGLVNDAAVSKVNASSARSVVQTGPNSVDEVGRYDTALILNVAEDDRLPDIAGWVTLVGTWDQERFPSLSVALHRGALTGNTTLTAQVIGLDLGDTVRLTGLPTWLPPEDVYELVQGYSESLSKFLWEIEYNATPAGPYRAVGILNEGDEDLPRLDAEEHTIGGSGLTTTGTSVTLVTPAGSAVWIDSATYSSDFPFDVVVGGEVMTMTAITGTSSPQTGTVTRSVNGVVKSHSSGAGIRLARPFFLGR